MKKRQITSIHIEETRGFHAHMPKGKQLILKYYGCIQENIDGERQVRGYFCSHWSIKRLAKIQEKLAQ